MECVQRHLSRWLSNWLSGNCTNILTWMGYWLEVFHVVHVLKLLWIDDWHFSFRSKSSFLLHPLALRILLNELLKRGFKFFWYCSKVPQRIEQPDDRVTDLELGLLCWLAFTWLQEFLRLSFHVCFMVLYRLYFDSLALEKPVCLPRLIHVIVLQEFELVKEFGLHHIHWIVTVEELDHWAVIIANSEIVADHERFKLLYQAPLEIARSTCLDSCIYKTFTSWHAMEEEVLRA